MTNLYALDLMPYLGPDRWRLLLEGLPLRRRQRVFACRREEDRTRIAGAGWLLRYALLRAGVPPEEQIFEENQWGKPALLRREGPQFSLSHSGPWAVCAVGDDALGVDIEAPRCTLPIARRFFHPKEVAQVEAMPPEGQPDTLCRLWTAKEAFIKAVGLGFGMPLSSFSIRLSEDALWLEDPDAPFVLHEYTLGAYRLCLCAGPERPALSLVTDGPVT